MALFRWTFKEISVKTTVEMELETHPTKKHKHPKKKSHQTEATFDSSKEEDPTAKKRQSVGRDCENNLASDDTGFVCVEREKKKKKKMKRNDDEIVQKSLIVHEEDKQEEETDVSLNKQEKKKKKKKRHDEEIEQKSLIVREEDKQEEETDVTLNKQEKKKKKKKKRDIEETIHLEEETTFQEPKKKKKKVHKSSDQACDPNGLEINAEVSPSASSQETAKKKKKTERESKTITGDTVKFTSDSTEKEAVKIEKKERKKKKKRTKTKDEESNDRDNQREGESTTDKSLAEEKPGGDENDEIVKKKKKKKKTKSHEDEKPFVASSDASHKENKARGDNPLLEEKSNVDEMENKKRKLKKKKTKDAAEEENSCDKKNESNEEKLANPPNKCGQWQGEMFDNSERQNKFLRLLGGMKKTPSSQNGDFLKPKRLFGGGAKCGEKKKGLFGSLSLSANSTSSSFANTALTTADADNLNQKLEDEYNRAMNFKLSSKKGIGLGFTPDPAENKNFHIDVNKTNSIKFDD